MKILIIADEGDQIQSVSSLLQETKHQVEQVPTAIAGNDVILSGLAMGQPYDLIMLDGGQDTMDTRELIRYWRSQDPFLPLIKFTQAGAPIEAELVELGLLDQIPLDTDLAVIRNRINLLQQAISAAAVYRLKSDILISPASMEDPPKAIDAALSLIIDKLPLQAVAFVVYTEKEDEPIIQITRKVDAYDQLWLDEICDAPHRFIEPILHANRMVYEAGAPPRYVFPIVSSKGWEGILIFFAAGEGGVDASSALTGRFSTTADGVEAMLEHVRARRELSHARTTKSEYMGILSHRIRQPISDMRGTAELLMMIDTDDAIKNLTSRVSHHAQMATDMLEDVIELGRIDEGMLIIHPTKMSMKRLIKRMLKKFDLLLQEKDISVALALEEEQDYFVEGDPDKLKKVFAHLLTNAIRFSPERATITIKLTVEEDGWVCTSIMDEGPGLRPEQFESIFERSAGATHSITEQGIGLYLCRKFIRAHEGKIWVESIQGLGATFFVRIRPSAIVSGEL